MTSMRAIALSLLCLFPAAGADLRLGIIGTDTSHAVNFTAAFNDPTRPDHVPGARVVAAYKGGSPDIHASWSRVDKFAAELETKWKIEFVPDIPTLCSKVDAILLETNDGRLHLEQAKQVIAARKPMFIDKPLASTLEDAREIARLAKEAGVPWFSSSGNRFGGLAAAMKFPDITSAFVWGPGPLEEHHHLELSWYAIHSVELLYTLMGTHCQEVSWMSSPDQDIVVGRWKDGRLGTIRVSRNRWDRGAVVFRRKQVVQSTPEMSGDSSALLREVVKFFRTGTPPVRAEETLEIFAFMDAAQRSKAAGGRPMALR